MTGDKAITAKVGETVRLFVGNGGPNLVSSFHVIGEVFDKVYVEGGDLINENIQTTLIPAGGAAIVDFRVEVPSTLILVDHSIFRAFNKGALGMLKVSGESNKKVFSGEIMSGIYHPEGGVLQEIAASETKGEAVKKAPLSKEEKIKVGKQIYDRSCFACHQPDGSGLPNAFPPLAKSDYLNADVERSIKAVVHGLSGEITVNGEKFKSVMPSQVLTDEEVASVLTYVYNSWNNNGSEVDAELVSRIRNQ